MDCSDPHMYLRPAGAAVLKAYDDLLMMLEGNCVGDIRLQNGLAAAVAGLSAKEFSELPDVTKESHRVRFVRDPIHRQLAPDLILYIGVPPPQHVDKPASSGRITFEETLQDSEFKLWHDLWEEAKVSPTAWGWVVRSLKPQAQIIFLSGLFVTWPTHWSQQSEDSPHKLKTLVHNLTIYLKVTLYHEFAHHLRNLVYLFLFSVDLGSCDAFRLMVFLIITLLRNAQTIPPRSHDIRLTIQRQLEKRVGMLRHWHLAL